MFQIEMQPSSYTESLAKASAIATSETSKWLTDMAEWIKADLMGRVPVKTSALQKSIGYDLAHTADGGEATFYASAKRDKWYYGVILDEGSKPHVIKAKNGKSLAFEKNGEKIFRSSVNHPGTKALDFTIKSLEAAEKEADKRIDGIADRIWAVIG